MKERSPITDFERLKYQLGLAQIRLSNGLRFLPDKLRFFGEKINYGLLVAPKAHEQIKINTRAFTMDMIDFLQIDTVQKLALLHADEGQRKLIPVLFESSKDSRTFVTDEIKPLIDYRGYPFLARIFRNKPGVSYGADETTRLITNIEAMLYPQFQIVARWGFNDHFTPTFDFGGYGPISFTTNLTLMASPEKIETPDQAAFYFGSLQPPTSVTEYQVYRDGRIVRHHLGPERLREEARTEQWRFLGRHKSGRINWAYFVYGVYDLLGLNRR